MKKLNLISCLLILNCFSLAVLAQPTVSSVSSTNADATYNIGDAVVITVTFSEAVNVSGSPRILLELGSIDKYATYTGGTGTTSLSFGYTVDVNDISADLDYQSTAALELNGSTIQNASFQDAVLTLASPGALNSISDNQAIVIDGVKPTVSTITGTNGTYIVGSNVDIVINFSESVNVTGTPTLTLETGSTDRTAAYLSGDGTAAITFRYTVQSGDLSSDLNYKAIYSLALSGGTIKDLPGNDAILTLPAPSSTSSLAYVQNIIVDGVVPTITNVTSTTNNGYYNVGDSVMITVSFTETVTVTGTPTLTLETGTADQDATYSSGSGSNTLVFKYMIVSGDASTDLDYQATTSLSGTIADAAGNAANLTLVAPGAVGSLGRNKNIVIDCVGSTVTEVKSSFTDSTCIIGGTVYVKVAFNEDVVVTRNPRILLETGSTDRYATYYTGSGSDTLTFRYTVQSGDVSPDLDYNSNTALELNGGTIKDNAGNTATLTLPAPAAAGSLGANSAIVIDGVVPTITLVEGVDNTYTEGETVSITVTFSEAVTVTGTPRILLETGPTDRYATYASGTGSTALIFNYTVVSTDYSTDLNYKSISSLYLNSGTLKDANGNNVSLTLPALTSSSSLGGSSAIVIDADYPTVTNVTSTTANGSYNAGDSVMITVSFSEAVNVTGSPVINLETGATDRDGSYISGSGTTTLLFKYTVVAGDASADLEYKATTSLSGGTIADLAGNAATLTLPSLGGTGSLSRNKNIIIDCAVPSVSTTGVTSTYTGTKILRQTITVSVHFTEKVYVVGSPRLVLETGSTDRYASYFAGSGRDSLIFRYTVMAGDISSDLDYTTNAALELNGGAITDKAGNAATLTLANPGAAGSLSANASLIIDGVLPTVSLVEGIDNIYIEGSTVNITVTFSEAVTVNTTGGTPRMLLETGTVDQYAGYISGTGTTALVFSYTVDSADVSDDLNYKGTSSLYLNSGTIKDANGNNAVLTLPTLTSANSLAGSSDIVIDAKLPTVTNVTSITNNGYYNTGDKIVIYVKFSEVVEVTGTPTLTLETGTTDRNATYISGSGYDTLRFEYTVVAGDQSLDLEYLSTSALALAGGTIKDTATNDATLTLPTLAGTGSLSRNKALIVDTTVPTVTGGVSSTNTDGTFTLGKTIYITVGFSEAVLVTGSPRINLETGTVDRFASYYTGNGSSTLKFRYVVQPGDVSGDLNYIDASSLILNGGNITDKAGNIATLTLGTGGSLAANKALVIDGAAPTVTLVEGVDGTYTNTETVDITVTFSEAVTVNTTGGTPRMLLETGTVDKYAGYISGTGTTALVFRYTVGSGDISSDLTYKGITSLYLNGGTIKDANGNNATLTLPVLTSASSLGGSSAIVVDPAPVVRFVTSMTPNGTYNTGDKVYVSVIFSENVIVTGTPRLQLETGGTDQYALYYSPSSTTSTLVFEYTVVSGDATLDLDYIGTTALGLNGGTITDAASNAAALTLPAPGATGSLGRNKSIIIDGSVKKSATWMDTEINNLTYPALNVYPVPSDGNFTVEMSGFNTSSNTIEIYDLLGRRIYSKETTSSKEEVNLDLRSGTYVILVHNGNQKLTKRIIIL